MTLFFLHTHQHLWCTDRSHKSPLAEGTPRDYLWVVYFLSQLWDQTPFCPLASGKSLPTFFSL